jgi:hypothetical protein
MTLPRFKYDTEQARHADIQAEIERARRDAPKAEANPDSIVAELRAITALLAELLASSQRAESQTTGLLKQHTFVSGIEALRVPIEALRAQMRQ